MSIKSFQIFSDINPDKNYLRKDTGQVFTGTQIQRLLEIAWEEMQFIILTSIEETDLPATNPDSEYGL
jgi:hypothetical protein